MHQLDRTPPANRTVTDRPTASVDDLAAPNGPPELSVEEVIACHRDEWILMRVTGFDEDGWPERGYLLAHSPRRGDVSEALAGDPLRSDATADAPNQPTYIFNAFPRGR